MYQADVGNNANKGIKIYFGLVETSFKAWFANPNKYVHYEQYKNNIELSKYIERIK